MRRKSERNKAKGSPEKKVEKPTRRTTRRRGKTSPSASPERENADDNVSSTPFSDDDKESRFQEEQSNDNEDAPKTVSSSELIKSVLGGDEEDNGSVWKVARADASPGEIQKLKLCRQRNISEASDSSSSKKKSNKWPESGEGGTEEADSADEQMASSQMAISEQTEDPSSLHPGQDSNEEVSDYKENLPETTSANLSDDKTNIDKLADFKERQPETTSTDLSESPNCEDNQSSSPSTHQPADNPQFIQSTECDDNVAVFASENLSSEQQNENSSEPVCFNSTASEIHQFVDSNLNINDNYVNEIIPTEDYIQNTGEPTNIDELAACYQEETTVEAPLTEDTTQEIPLVEDKNTESISISNETDLKNDDEEEEGEIREEIVKEPSSESDNVSNTKDESDTQDTHEVQSPVTESHSSQRKHHDKYRDSSTSDTPSDDEQKSINQSNEANSSNTNTNKSKKEKRNENTKTESTEDDKSFSVNVESELDLSESNLEKEDILEISEKSEDLNVSSLNTSKPAKVSLKRSFSTRISTDSENKKEENSIKKPNVVESNQNKENHADNEQPDQKSTTKRRRWGVTTSADAAPAFSISTDSLKALVPGAKPLSVNEVKLTKDEDEDKERRKSKNDSMNDHKNNRNDTSTKNDSKKGDAKMDNHIASRRKITVVKETPRPKSPSPPEAQATNILLIKNLVRPFTLNQIKELLSRTGTIMENGFWMDRIKSKCFVEYANEDQAFETRQALHGVSWPLSNPKKLIVEYATKQDMESVRESLKEQPAPPKKAEPLPAVDLWQQDRWSRDERPLVVNKVTIIREWDLGKEDGQLHGKEKERERKEYEKKKRQRSRSPALEPHLPAPARKFKKKEEDPPTAKLLDDLFRKTKATPCIYWLPLTNEQIIVKEEMRRQHMAEHARRLEEMRRAERNRDTRRRRSPRK